MANETYMPNLEAMIENAKQTKLVTNDPNPGDVVTAGVGGTGGWAAPSGGGMQLYGPYFMTSYDNDIPISANSDGAVYFNVITDMSEQEYEPPTISQGESLSLFLVDFATNQNPPLKFTGITGSYYNFDGTQTEPRMWYHNGTESAINLTPVNSSIAVYSPVEFQPKAT